jgi:hypothetical protein
VRGSKMGEWGLGGSNRGSLGEWGSNIEKKGGRSRGL